MLLKRKLQGGYFVQLQDIEDENLFANAEIQERLRLFRFFHTRDQMNSHVAIFECVPIVKSQLWKMMVKDFTKPVNHLSLKPNSDEFKEPSLQAFDALARLFRDALCDDGVRQKFLKGVFETEVQRFERCMLQCGTFDQRVKVIEEMEKKTKRRANVNMLKMLFLSTDIRSHQHRALHFATIRVDHLVQKWRSTSENFCIPIELLGPLLRLCADCNRRDSLMKYWAMKDPRSWSEHGLEVSNQLFKCFHTLPDANLAWQQLMRLIDPDAKTRWGCKTPSS
jgi:hypothetical protein